MLKRIAHDCRHDFNDDTDFHSNARRGQQCPCAGCVALAGMNCITQVPFPDGGRPAAFHARLDARLRTVIEAREERKTKKGSIGQLELDQLRKIKRLRVTRWWRPRGVRHSVAKPRDSGEGKQAKRQAPASQTRKSWWAARHPAPLGKPPCRSGWTRQRIDARQRPPRLPRDRFAGVGTNLKFELSRSGCMINANTAEHKLQSINPTYEPKINPDSPKI